MLIQNPLDTGSKGKSGDDEEEEKEEEEASEGIEDFPVHLSSLDKLKHIF